MVFKVYIWISLAFCQVLFHFGLRYGQVYIDHYGNSSKTALSGLTALKDDYDIIPTDRGAYFISDNSTIKPYPNEKYNFYSRIEFKFTIACWIMSTGSEVGRIYTRVKNSKEYFIISYNPITSNINFSMTNISNTDSDITNDNKFKNCKIHLATWNLLFLSINNSQVKLCINTELGFSLTLTTNYFEDSVYYPLIGHEANHKSFKGFMWYFFHSYNVENLSSFISLSDSGCSRLLNSLVLNIYGCISTEDNYLFSSNHKDCKDICESTDYGCNDYGYCLDCKCTYGHCKYKDNSFICDCPYNAISESIYKCVCPTKMYYTGVVCAGCNSDCSACTSSINCTSCISSNSYSGPTGCICKEGYYNVSTLTANDSCIKCHESCKSCNSETCLVCKSLNTEISAGICVCKSGFYSIDQLINLDSCKVCHQDCFNCSSLSKCDLCKSDYSVANENKGCDCITGYWKHEIDSESYECIQCEVGCASCKSNTTCDKCMTGYSLSSNLLCLLDCPEYCTCKESKICEKCKDEYSILFENTCNCLQSFYFNKSLAKCSECDLRCKTCESLDSCKVCKNSSLSPPNCYECPENCLSCIGEKITDCIQCRNLLINGFCSDSCPIGFINNSGNCVIINPDLPTLKYSFEDQGDTYYDCINQLAGVVSQRKNDLSNFPISVYLRGIYFFKESNMVVEINDAKVFNSEFSISIWMKPRVGSACIFDKLNYDQDKSYFKISYSEFTILTGIFVDGYYNALNSKLDLIENEWNHIFVTVEFNLVTVINLWINHENEVYNMESNKPFIDSDDSSIILGSDTYYDNDFTGFIYSLEIYAKKFDVEMFSSVSICKTCDICLYDGTCIPDCEIDEFYLQLNETCVSCSSLCYNSCQNYSTCSLCSDSSCTYCSAQSELTCEECQVNYELLNSTCQKCQNHTYYNPLTKTCNQCPKPCEICELQSEVLICLLCEPNSTLNSSSQCECNLGYSLKNTCQRNYFSITLTISQDNVLTLWFTEPPNLLKSSQIKVLIDNFSIKFEMKQETSKIYKITFDENLIKQDSIVIIEFLDTILSDSSSLLDTIAVKGSLKFNNNLKKSAEIKKTAKQAGKTAKKGAIAGISIALGISLLNFDPSSLFDFMNTAEMFYSVYLFNIDLDPVLTEFLIGLRINKDFPVLFNYFLDIDKKKMNDKKFNKFGYKTNLFFINVAAHLQVFILAMIGLTILIILSKIRNFGTKIKFLISLFKFNFFLRFWLQTFFEFCTAALAGIKYNQMEGNVDFFNFSTCILCLVSLM